VVAFSWPGTMVAAVDVVTDILFVVDIIIIIIIMLPIKP
jgi:hypothetical protein